MTDPRPARPLNIAIYVGVVLIVGNLAGFNFQAFDNLGGLVFILTPVGTALALRAFGGDGWGDAGFGLGRSGWAYLFALVYLPLLMAIAVSIGMVFGVIGFVGDPASLLRAVLGAIALFGIYGLFEEIGWRGYLEPRLAALGLAPLRRHVFVGVVWALWHIGYILSQPGYSPLAPALFWPILLVAMIGMAIVHGWLRARSGSVWPNVVLHAFGNVAGNLLIGYAELAPGADLVFAPRLEGLIVLALLLASGVVLMRRPAQPG